jgi:dTDP-glucose 4,6-dehydratase
MVIKYPQYTIVVYDKMTYAGNHDNLLPVKDAPNYRFEQGDIVDRETVRAALEHHQIDTIVNFAAESHVDRSILDPDAFLRTNDHGVYSLLEAARALGINRFHQVSTDEVYGSIPEGFFKEGDALEPNSPYAASKAGGELMVRAYHVTYGMHTTVTRGSNTFGPYHYPEKIAPFFITEAIDDRPLPVYGNGMQVRDWLYVEDHASAIELILHVGEPGEVYNVGGENERHNIELTRLILNLLGKPETLIKYVEDRPGHDRRYALNCEKIKALGWQRSGDFETLMEKTVRWYQDNAWWWRKIKTGEYLEFYKRQYAERLAKAGA